MSVRVYIPGDNAMHIEVLSAFANGIANSGHKVTVHAMRDYEPSQVAVVFGIGKKDVPVSYPRGEIIRKQDQAGKQTLVLERGYVRRDEYYAAGWGGLNGRANFRNQYCDPDRWNQLKVALTPWQQEHGSHFLLVGQVPSDASVQNVDFFDWCAKTAQRLRKLAPAMPVVFRPHPLALDRTPEIFGTKRSNNSLMHDIDNAAMVVTYNSNTGVDAILSGRPVYTEDIGSMCWQLASKNLEEAFYPERAYVEQWAYNLAYTQWTVEEMKDGLPWRHLIRGEGKAA